MSLTRRGDSTYANDQEANRAFWRQVLSETGNSKLVPLAHRIARALTSWLGALDPDLPLTFKPNLDDIEALSSEREALWTRLEAASFLTRDEKRAAAGYEAAELDAESEAKFDPNQPRDDHGRWTDGGGDTGSNVRPGRGRFAIPTENPVEEASRRGRQGPSLPGTPAQLARHAIAMSNAAQASRLVRQLDPNWRPPTSLRSSIEGEIAHLEAVARAAASRYRELMQGCIPGVNPAWSANRLRSELRARGFEFVQSTRDPGVMLRNPATREEVRIMERPTRRHSNDPPEKFYFDHYYRYRPEHERWRRHVPVPNPRPIM